MEVEPPTTQPSGPSRHLQQIQSILSSGPRRQLEHFAARPYPNTVTAPSHDDSELLGALYGLLLDRDHEGREGALFLEKRESMPSREALRQHLMPTSQQLSTTSRNDNRAPSAFVTADANQAGPSSSLNPFAAPGMNPAAGTPASPRWSLSEAQRAEKKARTDRPPRRRAGAICGAYLHKGERCFNCKTCAVDSSAVLCSECFFASDHRGHDVTLGIAYTSSGYCDCGDPSSWVNPCACAEHPPVASPSDPSSSSKRHPPPSIHVEERLENELKSAVHLAIEHVVRAMRNSPLPSNRPPPTTLDDLAGPGVTWEDVRGGLIPDVKGKAPEVAPRSPPPFCLILWTDDKHTYKEVARQVMHATGCSVEEAKRVAVTLDTDGRAIVLATSDYARLMHVAHTLAQIDLTVSIQTVEGVHDEHNAAALISWLADLCECDTGWDDLYLRRLVGSILLSSSESESDELDATDDFDGGLKSPQWVDRIFCLFPKLWKTARIDFFRIFVRILSSDMRMKLGLGNRFARVYHRMVNHYVFRDREPELSLLLWGAQLLPVPDVATSAVKHEDLLTKVMQVLISYFTEQYSLDRRIVFPPREVARVNADVQAFRTKKWQVITQHLKIVLQAQQVGRQVVIDEQRFDTLLAFLELFMGMAGQKRKTELHVEYESDTWIRALGVTMDLSRITSIIGRAFGEEEVGHDQLVNGVKVVVSRIITAVNTTIGKYLRPTFKQVKYFGRSLQIIDFSVSHSLVSVHNPLHWTLAELLQSAPQHDEIDLKALTKEDPLLLVEHSLRTVTYLAQVRAGMWVRNGIGMRGQLHHYRDHPLRETTFDLDMVMLRAGFCMADPETMLASIIDRFDLKAFLAWDAWTFDIDATQQAQMVEEFLIVLINVFSETWSLLGKSPAELTRREIVHQLALGPSSYSELTKKLSEKTVDIPQYWEILKEVATFKQPVGISDTGVYELRPECYDEVNPFFHHYSRNQQSEAYEALIKHRKTKGTEGGVVMPRPIEIPQAPAAFSNLLDIFKTPSMIEICAAALHNAIKLHKMAPSTPRATVLTPQTDGIVDLLLHLCLIALKVQAARSSAFAGRQNNGDSLTGDLCEIEVDDDYETHRPKISAILDIIQTHQPEIKRLTPRGKVVSAEEARKAAVKARQNAILAGFAKTQQQFIDNYGEDDEDEEIEEVTSYGPCIVCQEECNPSRPSGLLACLQPSKVVRELCVDRDWFEECLRIPSRLNGDTRRADLGRPKSYPDGNQKFGLQATACGHLMHEDCLAKFYSDTELRQRLQGQRNHPENAYRQEFVCPLCKSIGNLMVPLRTAQEPEHKVRTLAEWIRIVSDDSLRNVKSGANIWNGYLRSGELLAWFGSSLRADGRFTHLVKAASTQTSHLHTRGDLGLYLPEHIVAYTIGLSEIAQRGQASHDSYVSDTTTRLLRGLIHQLEQPDSNPSVRRICLFARLLPDWFRPSPLTSPLIHRDPLAIVVEAAALCPDILHPVITMCFYLELARTMLALTFWAKICMARPAHSSWQSIPCEDVTAAKSIFPKPRTMVLSTFRHSPQLYHEAVSALATITDDHLARLLYAMTLPFLRRATILTTALKVSFITPAQSQTPSPNATEYSTLLTSLAIPAPEASLLEPTSTLASIVPSWIKQWMQSRAPLPTLEYPGVYELYRLPDSLEAILRHVNKRKCKSCDREPLFPALCYYCGEFLCLGSDCCAQGEVGECNLHRMQ